MGAPAPLIDIADAMDHRIHETERLSFSQALEMYTQGAAFAAKAEERLGSLEVGFEADFIVLSHRGTSASITSGVLRAAEVEEAYVAGQQLLGTKNKDVPSKGFPGGRDGPGKLGL